MAARIDASRIDWLDGLRGVAAIQVVLLHYVTAFLPAIGLRDPSLRHYGWESAFIQTPLFLPFVGYSAVYIFFVLSGVALSCSFAAAPSAIGASILRRVLRLGLPMLVAAALGAAWFKLLPQAHALAATLTHSVNWLGAVGPDRVTWAGLLHQIGLEGMLAGYQGVSELPMRVQAALGLVSVAGSLNPPLWTLHVEFVGRCSSLVWCGCAASHLVRFTC